jgi:hypothetical protein
MPERNIGVNRRDVCCGKLAGLRPLTFTWAEGCHTVEVGGTFTVAKQVRQPAAVVGIGLVATPVLDIIGVRHPTSTLSSKILKTGFQYEPVLSITT